MNEIDIPQTLIDALRGAERVVAFTGAGVSAESGIPTFRDALTGLWAHHNPEDLATPEAFHRDPENVSRWYDQRRLDILDREPNPGHVALAEMERRIVDRGGTFTVVTQNIDRLHHRAGSRAVVELHGSITVWRCTETGEEREITGPAMEQYPPRTEAGGLLRPAVVWFGEMLPTDALAAADHACEHCDLLLSIGTSATVFPAAGYIQVAMAAGARTVEVNPEPTPFTNDVDWSLPYPSATALPALVERAFG